VVLCGKSRDDEEMPVKRQKKRHPANIASIEEKRKNLNSSENSADFNNQITQ
jgi:hypothetical protein